ncbi:hypothetical protein BS78_10G129700 [Paspalum vaginatum]|nr:hypothetical protein BS78_10G129700 [Paspalum vaginatum]
MSMGQRKNNGASTPFVDFSNNIGGHQDELNLLSPIINAKEHRRLRDRERYAAMTVEKRNEINNKRCEARQRNDLYDA